jgi:hypothetical protein
MNRMRTLSTRRRGALLACLLPALLAVGACDEGDGGGGTADTDTDSDGDTDSDSDTDTDTDTETETETETEGCSEIDWGSMCNVGQEPSDWQMAGWVDQDGDGALSAEEQTEVAFSLNDIHCSGKQSLIWLISDKY